MHDPAKFHEDIQFCRGLRGPVALVVGRIDLKGFEMLVLTRKRWETIVVGPGITITVADIRKDKVRIGIDVPREVPVHRGEVAKAIAEEKRKGERQQGDMP